MRSDIPLGWRRRFGLLMRDEDPFKKTLNFSKKLLTN